LATLDPVARSKEGLLHTLAVYQRAIGRAQISHIAMGWRYLKHTVISRKKAVIREAKMGRLAPSDQEGRMAIKCEYLAGVRSGQHFQINVHDLGER
jgi:hypothetical protein